jgi:hypothetical protein
MAENVPPFGNVLIPFAGSGHELLMAQFYPARVVAFECDQARAKNLAAAMFQPSWSGNQLEVGWSMEEEVRKAATWYAEFEVFSEQLKDIRSWLNGELGPFVWKLKPLCPMPGPIKLWGLENPVCCSRALEEQCPRWVVHGELM